MDWRPDWSYGLDRSCEFPVLIGWGLVQSQSFSSLVTGLSNTTPPLYWGMWAQLSLPPLPHKRGCSPATPPLSKGMWAAYPHSTEDLGKGGSRGGPIKWEAPVELWNTSHNICRGSCLPSSASQKWAMTFVVAHFSLIPQPPTNPWWYQTPHSIHCPHRHCHDDMTTRRCNACEQMMTMTAATRVITGTIDHILDMVIGPLDDEAASVVSKKQMWGPGKKNSMCIYLPSKWYHSNKIIHI